MTIADKPTLDMINNLVSRIGTYKGYRNTSGSIRYYLPENAKVICDRREVTVLQKEGEPLLIDEGYEITNTGYVSIIAATEDSIEYVSYNIRL